MKKDNTKNIFNKLGSIFNKLIDYESMSEIELKIKDYQALITTRENVIEIPIRQIKKVVIKEPINSDFGYVFIDWKYTSQEPKSVKDSFSNPDCIPFKLDKLNEMKRIKENIENIKEEINQNILRVKKDLEERTLKTYVAGTSFSQREIRKLVKEGFDSGEIIKYDGITNKEIREEYGYIDELVWEVSDFELDVDIVPEPNNEINPRAIRIDYKNKKLGYVPDKDLDTYYALKSRFNDLDAEIIVKGGKFKKLNIDDYGVESIETDTKDYYLDLIIVFN